MEKVAQPPAEALKWQTALFAEIPPKATAPRPGRREMEPTIPDAAGRHGRS